jgi:methionyl-tRNA formyltransferase
MRIVFMGTPDFAVPSLAILQQSQHEVVAVVTAPDKPSGRGRQLRPTPVKAAAAAHGLEVLQPEKLRQEAFVSRLQALQPDLMVVVAFRMLPEVVWSIPTIGTFNLHASLLPDYRGAAPINWVLINGEVRSGATTFFIDRQIDTGHLLLQTEVDIPRHWNAGDLHDHLMEVGAELVLRTVQGLVDGTLGPQPQDDRLARHRAPKLFKADCRIDWAQPAERLYHFIRGLSPYPTAWTTLEEQNLKVYRAEVSGRSDAAAPGTAVAQPQDGRLEVATGEGWIQLLEIQLPGKKRVAVEDFLRGYKGDWTDTKLG